MDLRAKELIRIGKKLFDMKRDVDSLWQEICYNFYPERADFVARRSRGDEFSDHLFSSYPSLARQELGNMLSTNLRPQSSKWFNMHVDKMELDENPAERKFLEGLTNIMWRAMYFPNTGLVRSTKQCDHDFVAVGNGVIMCTSNMAGNGLLYRNYHLKDCAWSENAEGKVDELHRKEMISVKKLCQMFPDTVSRDTKNKMKESPEEEIECRHVVLPTRQYEHKKPNGDDSQFTSLWIEIEQETILEEVAMDYFMYIVPRWQTIAGTVYGRSMATNIALPDGRTMQVVIRTLREAAEKYVDPPMVAVSEAIRGDIPLYPGGITYADADYDERLGEVLRPITQQSGNMPIGFEVAQALREDIRHAFFLDKITLPDPTNTDMTAFEVRRRMEEHIRGASPLFEPIEAEYSNPLCELTFNVMDSMGFFPWEEMPESLSDADVEFKFLSPLSDMTDQTESAMFTDVLGRVLGPAAQIDESLLEIANLPVATRDAMKKAGWPEKWFKPPEAYEQRRKTMDQMEEAQQMAMLAGQGGQAAQMVGEGGQELTKLLEGAAGGAAGAGGEGQLALPAPEEAG